MESRQTFQYYLFGQISKFAIQFFGFVLMSRLLSVNEIGVFTTAVIILTLTEQLRDFGLRVASVQAANRGDQISSNLFWINTSVGLFMAVLLIYLAKPISIFYNLEEINKLIWWMSLCLIFSGIQTQYHVILSARGNFRALVSSELIAQCLALFVGVFFAIAGIGYWALVMQFVFANLFLLIIRVCYVRWVPSRPRFESGTRNVLRVAKNLGTVQLLNWVSSNIDSVAISIKLGSSPLAIYNRAFSLGPSPQFHFIESIGNWFLPTVRNANVEIHSKLANITIFGRKLSQVFCFVNISILIGAPFMIPLLLGDKWEDSIKLLQILSIGGVFTSFSTVFKWTFILIEKSKILVILQIVLRTIMVFSILSVASNSITQVALVFTISSVTIWLVEASVLYKLLGNYLKSLLITQILLAGGTLLSSIFTFTVL